MSYGYDISRSLKNLKTKAAAILTALILASGGSMLLFSSTALAAGNRLYVGHGAVGNNTSCASPGYNSVQAAVNAATPGKTVYLCGGQFAEQVFISNSITLTGDPGSGLTAVGTTFATVSSYPSVFTTDGLFAPQALLVVSGAGTNATVSGLKISGPMPSNGGCSEDDYGILALGGNVSLNNDQVLNIADSNPLLYGCQFGVGIQIGREYWETSTFSTYDVENFSAKADIDNVTVSGYQKNGITVDGTGSSANISGSTVTGGGSGAPFGTTIAQNGIQISRGAKADISDNKVSNNAYSGTGFASSGGILIYGGCGDPLVTDVTIHDNKLVNNDVGIFLANYDPTCSTAATSPTRDRAYDNYISSDAVTNISGLCDGSASCGGKLIGYQAGVSDVGNKDSIFDNTIAGKGYAKQGKYNFSVTPPVFTQTGPNSAFVRPIDAGGSFPTTNANVYDNDYDNGGHHENAYDGEQGYGNHYDHRHNHWSR